MHREIFVKFRLLKWSAYIICAGVFVINCPLAITFSANDQTILKGGRRTRSDRGRKLGKLNFKV